MTFSFPSHLGDEAQLVTISATVIQSSGFDDRGYNAGWIVEDLTAQDSVGNEMELSGVERDRLKEEAVLIAQSTRG
jgi:hypothetical protein